MCIGEVAVTSNIRGAFGGSQLFDQPQYRAELEAYEAHLATERPRLMEIGFDHGRRLSHTAARHPDWTVVGLEIRRARVEQAQERSLSADTTNLLVWRADARTVLHRHTKPQTFRVIEALFPDPWWEEKHRRKRLLVDEVFVADAHRALQPGGLLYLATDVPGYAAHIEDQLGLHGGFARLPSGEGIRPACDAQSRREWRCEQDHLPVWRFWAAPV